VAGIYAVATDEPMRGRGYGRALTLAAMHAGREMGLDTAVLMASELGQPVYRRIGFREVGTVRFFRWPGVTDR
jgi:ribosomal protein S18 acetylase RimI-like enzyme